MQKSFYEKRKLLFSESLVKATKQINDVSNLRLAMAGALIICIYLSFSYGYLFFIIPLLLLAFILLVIKHARLFKDKTHLENLVKINLSEIQSLDGKLSHCKNGAQFLNPHHAYAYDLDIFGEGSLFQSINRSSTLNGESQLAFSLTNPLASAELILTKQQAIKELAEKVDFRQHFLATGMELEELAQDKQQLLEWVEQKAFLFGKPLYKIVLWIFPALTVALLLGSFLIDGLLPFAIFCAGLQWVFLGFHLKRVTRFHQYISRKRNILDKYARLLHLFGKENFQSNLLTRLSSEATDADKKIKTLASLVRALDARLNFMTNVIVNAMLLYDLQCVYRLEKWKEENAQKLDTWINVISETDVLSSFATLVFNNPDFTFPSITQEQKIVGRSIGHPLIQKHERVTNDLTFGPDHSVLIVTGANMAGKSTFLRTLGINMVLALNGAPVCAQEFTCPIIRIRSGMRTADSLQDHQSYFYAELDRLKTIMDELRSGAPLLILLDEILKGTNSTDKQAGSIALVKQLLTQSCLAIIATHDLALGDLEKEYPDRVENFCFEPTIENDQLSFDYKLKPGLAKKMNATFLMKKMGIISG